MGEKTFLDGYQQMLKDEYRWNNSIYINIM